MFWCGTTFYAEAWVLCDLVAFVIEGIFIILMWINITLWKTSAMIHVLDIIDLILIMLCIMRFLQLFHSIIISWILVLKWLFSIFQAKSIVKLRFNWWILLIIIIVLISSFIVYFFIKRLTNFKHVGIMLMTWILMIILIIVIHLSFFMFYIYIDKFVIFICTLNLILIHYLSLLLYIII